MFWTREGAPTTTLARFVFYRNGVNAVLLESELVW